MAKSDNNRTLVCGAKMLQQGVWVKACASMFVSVQQTFLLVVPLFVRKLEIRRDRVSERY